MSIFKINDKVICISSNNVFKGQGTGLTLHKEYVVVDAIDVYIYVINDRGNRVKYYNNRFVKLSEYRNSLINDILNE